MDCVAKRTRSHTNLLEAKKVKMMAIENLNMTTVFDMNNDCLEEVFSHLSQYDLLNVHLAYPELKVACENTFARKFGRVPVIITYRKQNDCAKLLKLFGHLITKMQIILRLSYIGNLLEAIKEHCGDMINELEFLDVGWHSDCQHIHVKKRQLETRKICTNKMISFVTGLNVNYPNLVDLKVKYSVSSDCVPYSQAFVKPIQSVRALSVCDFTFEQIRQFIHHNDQLESLTIMGGTHASGGPLVTEQLMTILAESLPRLRTLNITNACIEPIKSMESERSNRFADLTEFKLGSRRDCFRSAELNLKYLSFLGEDVTQIELVAIYNTTVGPKLADSISRFKKLDRLIVHLDENSFKEDQMLLRSGQVDVALLMRRYNHLTEVIVHLYRLCYGQPCYPSTKSITFRQEMAQI